MWVGDARSAFPGSRLFVVLWQARAAVAVQEDWAIGVLGPLTSITQHFLAAAILFDLDVQKHFNVSVRERFGPPIIDIPNLHPRVHNISVWIGNSDSIPSTGMETALNMFLGKGGRTPVSALVGGFHSSITMPVASLAGTLKIPQISYASTNPSLSNKVSYPYFMRTIPSDALQGKAMWCWMNTFSIFSVAYIYALEPYAQGLFGVVADLAKASFKADRVLGVGYPYLPNYYWNASLVAEALQPVFASGRKFIMLTAPDDFFVVPLLIHLGLFDGNHQVLGGEGSKVWLFPLGFQFFFPVNHGPLYPKFEAMWSNMTVADCLSSGAASRYGLDRMVKPLSQGSVPMLSAGVFANLSMIHPDVPFLFDAAYAFVLAVNSLLNEGKHFEEIQGETLLEKVNRTSFEGVSGIVTFDSFGDREASYELRNKQSSTSQVTTIIGLYSARTGQLVIEQPLYWMDGSRNTSAPVKFQACNPGFYSNTLTGQCDLCPKGFWCAGGLQSSYNPCARGSFTDKGGEAHCTVCRPGRYVPDAASSSSYPCLKGFYAAASGMDSCDRCPRGTYAEVASAEGCVPCIGTKTTAESGADNASMCICDDGHYVSSESCVPCKYGMKCKAGLGEPTSQPGFWIDPSSVADGSYSVFSCRPFECPGGSAGTCAEGRMSTACNNCRDSYYASYQGICKECRMGDAAILLSVFVVILILVIVGLRVASSDMSHQSLHILTISIVFSQLIMVIQALGSIQAVHIVWVEPAKSVLDAAKLLTFDFDVVHVSCLQSRDDPVIKMVFQLLALPFCVFVVFVSWGISKVCTRLYGKAITVNHVLNLCGMLLYSFFISITLSVLLPFQCIHSPNGKYSMVTNPGLVCFESKQHIFLLALAVIGIIIYPVSTLAFTVHTVVKHPYRVASGSGLHLVERYRFLFNRFRLERYYFSLVILVRNALVALIPVVLANFGAIQVLAMAVLFGAASASQSWSKPWRTRSANVAGVFMELFLVLIVVSAALFLQNLDGTSEQIIGNVVFIAVLAPLVGFLIILVYCLFRKFNPLRPYGAFLCHHKGGAGVLARLMKLILIKHSTVDIFLDCDQLEDLDLLFDIVRADTQNLFIILSKELLKRMWCAGEIVTAHRNSVRMVPIICQGFAHPSREELINFPDIWTEHQKHVLCSNGIMLEHIMPAFLFVQQLIHIEMPRQATLDVQEHACIEIIAAGRLRRKAFTEVGKDSDDASILVTGWMGDPEEVSLSYVFQLMVQQKLQKSVVVVRNETEVESFSPSARHLVVLLVRNLLQDPCFARILLRATAYHLAFVPVNSDPHFHFPSAEFYIELERNGLSHEGLGPEVGPSLSQAVRLLMTILAWPLSPLGSRTLLSTEITEICRRFHEPKAPMNSTVPSEIVGTLTCRHSSKSSKSSTGTPRCCEASPSKFIPTAASITTSDSETVSVLSPAWKSASKSADVGILELDPVGPASPAGVVADVGGAVAEVRTDRPIMKLAMYNL